MDENKTKESMDKVALKYHTYISADDINVGDIVSLKMSSDQKKFNRSIKLNVMSGMFDKDFEQFLVGKKKNELYTYIREGLSVNVTIEDITRLVIPDVNDEMAKKEGIEGVNTVAELEQYFLKNELRTGLTNEFYSNFVNFYIGKCEFEVDNQDIEYMIECEMNRCREIAKTMNMVFDEMTEDQLAGAVGCRTIAEFKIMLNKVYNKNLRVALTAAAIKGENGDMITYENVPDYFMWLRDKTIDLAIKKILD